MVYLYLLKIYILYLYFLMKFIIKFENGKKNYEYYVILFFFCNIFI